MQPTPLNELPQTQDVWEVGMIHAKYELDGKTTMGLLTVVDRHTGTVRLSSAVMEDEPPSDVFLHAFRAPPPPAKPSRPKQVVFDDPWLREQLADVLEEVNDLSVTTESTSTLDDAIALLLNQAGAPMAPGIDGRFAEWRAALRELIQQSPWKALDPRATFSFSSGALDASVATLSGRHGELIGLVLYPTREELASHRLTQVSGKPVGVPHTALHLMLEPRSGLSAEEFERCMRVGLQFPPGLYPRVYAFTSTGLTLASITEQERLLSAAQAIAALCRAEQTALEAGEERTLALDDGQMTGARS